MHVVLLLLLHQTETHGRNFFFISRQSKASAGEARKLRWFQLPASAPKTLTVIGLVDPLDVVGKLRKNWPTDIIFVGPAKEPEQPKEEAPKEEGKKEETKEAAKQEPKEGEAKKEEGKKEEDEKKKLVPAEEAIKGYNYRVNTYPPPYVSAPHYYAHSMEENPNACVIS